MYRKLASSFSLLIVLSASIPAHAGQKPWKEFRSPHFRVMTDGSQFDALSVATEFEEMRYVFEYQFPTFRLDSGAPLTIFAVGDPDAAKTLAPALFKRSNLAGEFHHGWEKQFVIVRMDTWGRDAHEVVYHEYAHSILHMNSHWLPTWLDEGSAEFYAYTRFQNDKIYVGAPTERYAALKNRTLLPVETVMEVDHRSPYYRDEDMQQVFYADAWALVHYMLYGREMQHGVLLNQFTALLQKGVSQKQAFAQVFGDSAKFNREWSNYVNQPSFTAAIIPGAPKLDSSKCTFRKLSVAETELELGAFHIGEHDFKTGDQLVEAALADDPKLGAAHEEKAFALFRLGKDQEAIKEFDQAYSLDPTLYRSLFAKSMMSPEATSTDPSGEAALEADLKKVTEINPKFAPAFVELALLYSREHHNQAAYNNSSKAELLEPSRAGYHLLTGRILLAAGQGAQAAPFATFVAERWFGPDHNEAVDLWNDIPAAKRPANVALTLQSPAGEDVRSASGLLQSTHCSDGAKDAYTATLLSDGKPVTYVRLSGGFNGGFSDTLWMGEDHFSFCRHLEGDRATIYYKPTPAGTSGDYAGQIVSMEVRDNMAAAVATATIAPKGAVADLP